MFSMNVVAKILIITGVLIAVAGILFLLVDQIPSFPFRLPGDILIRRKNYIFYFPLGLCILLSFILTIIFRFFK